MNDPITCSARPGKAALQRRIVAVLNIGSGSCDAGCEEAARDVFDAAGLAHAEIVAVAPEGLEAALDGAVARADVLVVLGGDGTIAAAASRCGSTGALLVPLPGGTMNMLPGALYGARKWREALADTLRDPVIREVSGGKADEHPFYCAAILGSPSLWAPAREAVRDGHLVEAVKHAITAAQRSLAEQLDYDLGDGQTRSAQAVVVICPVISRDMRHDEPALELAAVDHATAASLFGLAFHAAFDDWRKGEAVSVSRVTSLHVAGEAEVPVILDGETVRFGQRVAISFVPVAFRALVPVTASP